MWRFKSKKSIFCDLFWAGTHYFLYLLLQGVSGASNSGSNDFGSIRGRTFGPGYWLTVFREQISPGKKKQQQFPTHVRRQESWHFRVWIFFVSFLINNITSVRSLSAPKQSIILTFWKAATTGLRIFLNDVVVYYSLYPQICGTYYTKLSFKPLILWVNLSTSPSFPFPCILNDMRHPIR